MCMGPGGDESGVSVGECAVRMARAGANLVGVNCLFDPFVCLDVIKSMKVALKAFELEPYLMAQPLGYRVLDAKRPADHPEKAGMPLKAACYFTMALFTAQMVLGGGVD